MSIREIFEKFNTSEFQGKIAEAECMARHTTMRVGGNAEIFTEPVNEKSLFVLLSFIKQNDLPYFILGGGSNIIVADEGLNKIVVSMNALENVSLVEKNGKQKIFVQAGCPMARLVSFCAEHGIAGFEKFSGLPGTAGGALFMNARSFEKEISECVDEIEYVDVENGKEKTKPPTPDWRGERECASSERASKKNEAREGMRATEPRKAGLQNPCRSNFLEKKIYSFDKKDWGYKSSPVKKKRWLVTGAYLHADERAEKKAIEKKCAYYISERKAKGHFDFPSAGSVFKNNRSFGKPSGKIIDEAGLRGFAVGGAEIASFHGNFIINKNHASAGDISALVNYAKKTVAEKYGFHLECEIIFVK